MQEIVRNATGKCMKQTFAEILLSHKYLLIESVSDCKINMQGGQLYMFLSAKGAKSTDLKQGDGTQDKGTW